MELSLYVITNTKRGKTLYWHKSGEWGTFGTKSILFFEKKKVVEEYFEENFLVKSTTMKIELFVLQVY